MTSTGRAAKRPRVSNEHSRDHDYDLGHPFRLNESVSVKAEAESPLSEPTAYSYSHQASSSISQTPEQTFVALSPYPDHYLPPTDVPPYVQSTHTPSHSTPTNPIAKASPSVSGRPLKPPRNTSASSSKTLSGTSRGHTSSAFRNVSACNRCRLRKNRCDQLLPACKACEKAGVKCVGYDPFLGREVPRSYVFYLESRGAYLEKVLQENGIQYLSVESFALEKHPESELPPAESAQSYKLPKNVVGGVPEGPHTRQEKKEMVEQQHDSEQKRLDNLVSNIGMVYVQGSSDPRYLGATSGISFARVVMAAVKSTMSRASSDKGARSVKNGGSIQTPGAGSLRDSAFGLYTKPAFKQASFPEQELGLKLVNLYFEHANPQLPILHRGEFMELVERVYSTPNHRRTPKEAYLLKIVFAIGAGIIFEGPSKTSNGESDTAVAKHSQKKRPLSTNFQYQPEEYHASAIVHLENFLKTSTSGDPADSTGNGLEELQAVLLLASFALLRPVAPGLWYIVGIAMRLAVDLGLHHEDGTDNVGLDSALIEGTASISGISANDLKDLGRRQWTRDLRRRLWWCVYSVDRLVSTAVGRPFGITDQNVTAEFPSPLDDRYITRSGFLEVPANLPTSSAKFVAHHYFRLRLLHSEIGQVLQFQNAQRAQAAKAGRINEFMYSHLQSPFLQNFNSFRDWRSDVDRRLWEWKESAPTQEETGVQFSSMFLDLNYWQTVVTLYQPSLSTPPALAHQVTSLDDGIASHLGTGIVDGGDDEFIYLKVAEAGQKVLKLYRQLHRVHLVNYTYLATHHLFMAGISFLYAIWHSVAVRSHLSLDDVDFTVLAATSVLSDLVEKCPPAEACKDAFDRMSRACIQMCMSTTGFGSSAAKALQTSHERLRQEQSWPLEQPGIPRMTSHMSHSDGTAPVASNIHGPARPSPRFDMNLRDLFSEDESKLQILQRPSNQGGRYWQTPMIEQQQQSAPRIHQILPGVSPYAEMNQPHQYGLGDPQLQYTMANDHSNIDPLLQQTSHPNQASVKVGQQQPEIYTQQHQTQLQSTPYGMMNDYNTSFLDNFQLNNQNLDSGDLNLDLLGVGGADGGVDMFNGFFFGTGGIGQNIQADEFGNA